MRNRRNRRNLLAWTVGLAGWALLISLAHAEPGARRGEASRLSDLKGLTKVVQPGLDRDADAGSVSGTVNNDDCITAPPISGAGPFAFDNTAATLDGPAHSACNFFNQVQFGRDVWYCWTAPAEVCPGNYVVETCGLTGVDTKIGVYKGCSCPPAAENLQACRDDDCGTQTRAVFTALPGQSYLIRLGTFPGENGGTGEFTISCEDATPCTEPASHCQIGDQTDAFNSNRTSFRVADGFTPTESGSIDGVCWWGTYVNPDTGNCQGQSPDSFEIRYFTDTSGVPDSLIATYSQSLGTLIVEGPVPTGLAINLTAPEYEFHATHAPLPVIAGECLWIEISNALTGCNWFWEVALNGDSWAMQDGFPTPPPDGYTIEDGVFGDMAFCVNLAIADGGTSCLPPAPTNDHCENASPITGTGEFLADNTAATTSGPSHSACLFSGESGIDKDVWYEWTSACNGRVVIRACDRTDIDTKFAVYNGTTCPTAATSPVTCNDDLCSLQSMLIFNTVQGQKYLLRIGSFPGSAGGPIGFEITCGPPNHPSCPGTGSCCGATGGPGCGDELCCETVCACDPFCCNVEWDPDCAASGFGGSGCGAADLCGCGSTCGQPDAGDCCSGNGTPGCNDTACCEAVCACDPFCCDTEWDNNCATDGFVDGCGAAVLCTGLCQPPPSCPAGVMTYTNPPSGAVDARRPFPGNTPGTREGFRTFTVSGPAGASASSCWSMCERNQVGGPNSISSVVEGPAGTYAVTLARPITMNSTTTITYTPGAGAPSVGVFVSHPANIDGNTGASPADILALIDHLNGVRIPPLVLHQCDTDRSGACNPADILTEIDMLNGANGWPTQNGSPRSPLTCP